MDAEDAKIDRWLGGDPDARRENVRRNDLSRLWDRCIALRDELDHDLAQTKVGDELDDDLRRAFGDVVSALTAGPITRIEALLGDPENYVPEEAE